MRRLLLTVLAAAILLAMAAPASAARGGVSPDTLTNAGWTCFPVGNLGIHCFKDISTLGTAEAVPVMVFDESTGDFEGTELLIHHHLFNDQPCPQDGGQYLDLDPLPYFACHHYDS